MINNPNNQENIDSISKIEQEMAVAKKSVKLGEAINALSKNANFKLLFTQKYFKEYLTELVLSKTNDENQTDIAQDRINRELYSISLLYKFLDNIKDEALLAEISLKTSRDYLINLETESEDDYV